MLQQIKQKLQFRLSWRWHDWYLAANLKNKNNLNNHLFKGLKAKGIPNELKIHRFYF